LACLLLTGCVEELPHDKEPSIVLKVFCEDPVQTKTIPGVDAYNENDISWIDFFFYSGNILREEGPVDNLPAVMYRRIKLAQASVGSHEFRVSVSTQEVQALFPEGVTQITVFALVNYPSVAPMFANDLTHTTLAELYDKEVETVFANSKMAQDRFMMRSLAVLDLNGRAGRELEGVVSQGSINLTRYASKLTVAVHLKETVILNGNEKWHPMREGLEVYLVDGVNTVKLSGKDDTPSYFDYSGDRRRFAVKDPQTGVITNIMDSTVVNPGTPEKKVYYNTYPMYMYPQSWNYGSDDKETAFDCEPHIKLILPWYREEDAEHEIFANQHQCYYKVMLPQNFDRQFVMNTWYHLDLDIEILGALTDENAVPIDPGTCFIVPWQNEGQNIQHNVSVGQARYLYVDRDSIVVRNDRELSIPFLTSHRVRVKAGSLHMTRPYYGLMTDGQWEYDEKAMVLTAGENDIYPPGTLYLDYRWGKYPEGDGYSYTINGFSFTVKNEEALVLFEHDLVNDYTRPDFDYSPYSIFFTLEHDDQKGPERTVRIEQYPAVYIDRVTNSDAKTAGGTTTVYPKSNATTSPVSVYWGFVFVDGGAYWPNNGTVAASNACIWQEGARQNRRDKSGNKDDMFFKLNNLGSHTLDSLTREEYQWRTVWYTGGSLDIFQISVTALPEGSEFVLGDPRTYKIRNIKDEYKKAFESKFYDSEGHFIEASKLPEPPLDPRIDPSANRDGFAIADALYPEGDKRTLRWYYPADTTNRTKSMLAPSYRISSKFSGVEFSARNAQYFYTPGISKEYAFYRCATYQEDGFPAGRWRLPTMGEVKFIAMLSSNGVFAELFSNGGTYWSANGAIKVNNGGSVETSTAQEALLRCVYDTWYWGEDQSEFDKWSINAYGENVGEPGAPGSNRIRDHFVWGDMPR
jgi:hypothetical protein